MSMALQRDVPAAADLTSWPARNRDDGGASITASLYDPSIERQRALLMFVVAQLARTPATWSEREPVPVERVSVDTALAFIRRLPADRALPEIAPDGEGGIVLIWKQAASRALITVDRSVLSLVRDPGGSNSYHFSPMRFDGETIPHLMLEHLPRRR